MKHQMMKQCILAKVNEKGTYTDSQVAWIDEEVAIEGKQVQLLETGHELWKVVAVWNTPTMSKKQILDKQNADRDFKKKTDY